MEVPRSTTPNVKRVAGMHALVPTRKSGFGNSKASRRKTPGPSPKQVYQNKIETMKLSVTKLEECLSTMSTSIEKNLSCVCLDTASNPRILPCGHIFCRTCIATWFKTSKDQCPTCRAFTKDTIQSETARRFFAEIGSVRTQYMKDLNDLQLNGTGTNFEIKDLNSYMVKNGLVRQLMLGREINGNLVPYGNAIHNKIFPAHAVGRQRNQEGRNRRGRWRFAFPWNNRTKMNDMVVSTGFFFCLLVGHVVHNSAIEERWNVWQTLCVCFVYLWSVVTICYALITPHHNLLM